MRPPFKKIIRRILSLGLLFAFIIFSGLAILSFRINRAYAEIWEQLGTTNEKLHDNIEMSFIYDYLNYYGATKIKNIAMGDRAAIAKDLMQYTKRYVNGEAFKKRYETHRNNAKPREPVLTTKTKEDIRNKTVSETEKSISSMEETIKKNPQMEKDLKPVLEMMKTNLKDYKDPNSKHIEMLYQAHLSTEEQKKKNYTTRMEKWEKDLPADYRQLVKRRLQKFIDIASTVDFSAELKDVKGKKIFINQDYERKSSEWKQIFRAGKSVIDPSMTFARQWISEIK